MILTKETNLYDDDAISEALLQTVSNIFYDENMFNILTHNGAIQGLFWDNGQVYANMNYLRSGTLVLGGLNNISGSMTLKDANDTEIGKMDKDGFVLKTGMYVTHKLGLFNFPYLYINNNTGAITSITEKSGYGLEIDNSYGSKGYGFKFIAQRTDSNTDYSPYKYEEYYVQGYPIESTSAYASSSGIVVGKTGGSATFYNQYKWGDGFDIVGAQNTTLLYRFSVTHNVFQWVYEATDIFANTIFRMANNNLLIRTGGHDVTLSSQGFKYDGYNIATTSALRYKHDISETLDDDLSPDKLYKLKVKQFVYNEGREQYPDTVGKTIPGFIAEDVADIYPSAVIHNKEGEIESWDGRRIIPGMLALIQEQKKQIDELQETVDRFKQIIHVA